MVLSEVAGSAPHDGVRGPIVTAGQVSGARTLLSSLPDVDWLLGDRGYDTDWLEKR